MFTFFYYNKNNKNITIKININIFNLILDDFYLFCKHFYLKRKKKYLKDNLEKYMNIKKSSLYNSIDITENTCVHVFSLFVIVKNNKIIIAVIIKINIINLTVYYK